MSASTAKEILKMHIATKTLASFSLCSEETASKGTHKGKKVKKICIFGTDSDAPYEDVLLSEDADALYSELNGIVYGD